MWPLNKKAHTMHSVSLSNHDGDAEENVDKNNFIIFTKESRGTLKSFALFITVALFISYCPAHYRSFVKPRSHYRCLCGFLEPLFIGMQQSTLEDIICLLTQPPPNCWVVFPSPPSARQFDSACWLIPPLLPNTEKHERVTLRKRESTLNHFKRFKF